MGSDWNWKTAYWSGDIMTQPVSPAANPVHNPGEPEQI